MMKKLFAVAAFLLASTAAQAQYSFEYGGRTIRIDPDRGTVSIPGVYDNSGPRTKRSHSDRDGARPRKQQSPEQAKTDPPSGPQPATPGIHSANTPVGVWLTEEKEGKVRIEQCGANLCGYSVDNKSNQNGEQILINMKPGKDSKWSGRIHDPKSGSTYDSTIALKGSDTLRVQGCAFGGMFCGGQTWSRVN